MWIQQLHPMKKSAIRFIRVPEGSWQRPEFPVPGSMPVIWKKDYTEFDYLIGMDRANIHNMTRIAGGDPDKKIYKMMEFSGSGWKQAAAGIRNPEQARDVADPWYTGNFDETWNDVVEGCAGFLEFLEARGEV